jgi:ubiquinone/menaquinone biosynthesis C-methylase UbiE
VNVKNAHGTKTWGQRQAFCENWYDSLSPEQIQDVFISDYRPYVSTLQSLSGRVLDVGGGCGFAGHYLSQDVSQYLVVDPSLNWRAPKWRDFLTRSCEFVVGVGELLPFRASSFDVVLSMWSLNHAQHPEQMCTEMIRVLKTGGKIVCILEESEPLWSDLLSFSTSFGDISRAVIRKLLGRVRPVAEDHIFIPEHSLMNWFGVHRCRCVEREWRGGYLYFVFVKT